MQVPVIFLEAQPVGSSLPGVGGAGRHGGALLGACFSLEVCALFCQEPTDWLPAGLPALGGAHGGLIGPKGEVLITPGIVFVLWPLVFPVRLELAVLPSAWAGQQLGGSASTQQLIQLGASRPGPFPGSLTGAGLFSEAALLSVPGGFLATPSSSSERSPANGSSKSSKENFLCCCPRLLGEVDGFLVGMAPPFSLAVKVPAGLGLLGGSCLPEPFAALLLEAR